MLDFQAHFLRHLVKTRSQTAPADDGAAAFNETGLQTC